MTTAGRGQSCGRKHRAGRRTGDIRSSPERNSRSSHRTKERTARPNPMGTTQSRRRSQHQIRSRRRTRPLTREHNTAGRKTVPAPIPRNRRHKPIVHSGMERSPTAHTQPKSIPMDTAKSSGRSCKGTNRARPPGSTHRRIPEYCATFHIHPDHQNRPCRAKRSAPIRNDRSGYRDYLPIGRMHPAQAPRENRPSSMCHC